MSSLDLPLILAGPIVRRVEPTQIIIWIATSKKCQIDAEIFMITSNDTDVHQYSKQQTNTVDIKTEFGRQLFLHLIKITPVNDEFSTNKLIGYNLSFDDGENHHDLGSLDLLSQDQPQSIVYGNLNYPAFYIPSENLESTILYGSCRKPHGIEDDALPIADSLLEKNYQYPEKRPQALFLMGDQIYADDVAYPLIQVISKLAQEIMGEAETLEKVDSRLLRKRFKTMIRQINGRQTIMEKLAKFTSTHAQNHLIQLGEYAVMYLLAWSPALWETAQSNGLFYSFAELEQNNLIYYKSKELKQTDSENVLERWNLRQTFFDQQEALISFQDSLTAVRRLLANLPTYMIFDDHDITDDWNLTQKWKSATSKSPLGRHVISNGLLAYWGFQGWGNDPDSFDDHFLQRVTSILESKTAGHFNEKYDEDERQLLEFDSWHFTAPTQPRSLFLDTRTQRAYGTNQKKIKLGNMIEEGTIGPELLNKKAWETASAKLFSSGWSSHTPLIIVSPSPVYGMGIIESFVHDFVSPLRVLWGDIQTTIDYEAWKYNEKGFTDFLVQAANWSPSKCVILSGDVHYASEVKAAITFGDGNKLDVHQCTSSPLKNISLAGIKGFLLRSAIEINTTVGKNKQLHRICTPEYEIISVEKVHHDGPFIWEDILTYQNLKGQSVIETKNNLGMVYINQDEVINTLLKK